MNCLRVLCGGLSCFGFGTGQSRVIFLYAVFESGNYYSSHFLFDAFTELWLRPYKRRMESMLLAQKVCRSKSARAGLKADTSCAARR